MLNNGSRRHDSLLLKLRWFPTRKPIMTVNVSICCLLLLVKTLAVTSLVSDRAAASLSVFCLLLLVKTLALAVTYVTCKQS